MKTKFIKVDASIDPIIEANYYCIFLEGQIFTIPFSKEFGFHEEFTDCSGITHYLLEIPDNESALTKRVEELEAMLEKVKILEPIICLGGAVEEQWMDEAQALNNMMNEITELLNKNLKP